MMRLAARNSVDRSRTGAATAFSRPRLVEDNGAPAGAFLPHRLRPPRSLVSCIERRTLLSRIEEGLSGQVVTICAPAGFGKTEVLATIYDKRRRPEDRFCWMTLDPADGDPKVFLHDLATAIASANSSGDRDEVTPVPSPDASLDEAISAIRSMLLSEPEPVTIFLDDFHAPIGAGFRDCFDLLLRRLPQETRILLASRGKPEIPVSRLRVRHLLTEITAEDLAFSRTDVQRLFAGVVTQNEMESLLDVTSGWPALVQLARLALSERTNLEAKEDIICGRHPSFSEFLNEEVLSGAPKDLPEVLSVCAILDTFPVDLVIDLAGVATTAAVLTLIQQLSPALQWLRQPQRWLRMTPVLRATLLTRAEKVSAEVCTILHVRAASWFAERGIFDGAVRHAAHGGDFSMAVEAIRRAGGVNIFLRMGYTVLRRLLSDLPTNVIYASPELRLCHALMLSKEGQIQTARDIIEGLKEGGADNAAIPPTDLEHIDGMLDIYEDKNLDDDQVAKLHCAAHDFQTYNTWERGWIYNHLCLAYQRSGDLRAARLTGLKALSCYRQERTPYAQIFMLGHIGTVLIAGGRLSAASNVLRQADQLVQETQWSDANIGALVNIPRATCLYHQGDVAEASRLLASALPVVTQGEGWVDMFAAGFSTFARAKFLQEGLEASLAVLDQGEVLAIERALPRLELSVALARIDLLNSRRAARLGATPPRSASYNRRNGLGPSQLADVARTARSPSRNGPSSCQDWGA